LPVLKSEFAHVNENGELVIPASFAGQFGLQPGASLRLEAGTNHLRLHRPVTHMAKVYIEPTTICNLECAMCIRQGWEEPLGRMTQATFQHILDGLVRLEPLPKVFFGGLGEPLFHRRTIEWISQVKTLGAQVELITNGTALTEKRSRQLIDAGLDVLWVSIDGASPESYADVRLGAELPRVIKNLERFRSMRTGMYIRHPAMGIAFVAMRRNIADLPKVIKLGRSLGATLFSISNVVPYTEEMLDEQLYNRALRNITYISSPWLPSISLPKLDINNHTQEALFQALNSGCYVSLAGSNLSEANDVCNFIASGSMSIAWDGGVSPCWPLMHTHVTYLHHKERRVRRHIVGNVNQMDLGEIWMDPAYLEYRTMVQGFGFPPCTFCGGCDLSEANEDDCMGNGFPACGGCLWSQGVIQCP
jgi:MoaA/NifB/PqqE/SkfB family radical SAM enzyme